MTWDQLTLGVMDRDTGAAAALNAKAEWGEVARCWIENRPIGSLFTSDDLLADIGTPVDVATNRNNAIGAAFLAAKTLRLINPVGRVPSHRRTNHGRYITQWERFEGSAKPADK